MAGEGKDIMSVLLRANMSTTSEERISDDELLGHMSSIDSIFILVQSTVIIGIAASNTDRPIWGNDAHDWKPERWLGDSPLKQGNSAKTPGIYNGMMTFLGGGRACMCVDLQLFAIVLIRTHRIVTCSGYRFAEMEMKAILYTL
ncbi:hypothetical protein EUX98_g8523 [Antrodiella citrinella]|uniref:Cytochrome P450 n=1 Tax=Antrodiella citrinella TaxID=2447956 RepID=A0A4S4M6R2_9APHY|nr:hypothetical protein EUX98_g8523 [Antrodiella citrinella]